MRGCGVGGAGGDHGRNKELLIWQLEKPKLVSCEQLIDILDKM